MHSGSKYFGGHSDLLCGVLAVKRADWAKQLRNDRLFLGSILGNMESWLGVRSLRTLEIRVQRQSATAEKLVGYLDDALRLPNPTPGSAEAAVQAVLLQISHASLQAKHEPSTTRPWLLRQMPNGFGPVFSILVRDAETARVLPSRLACFQHATSLGGVESLVEWRSMTDVHVDRRLLRVSVGLENLEDLWADLVAAFRGLA